MKLELKHLAPYLPYGLELYSDGKKYKTIGFKQDSLLTTLVDNPLLDEIYHTGFNAMKPILRPLADLDKPEFEMDDWRKQAILSLDETANLPYNSRESHIGGIVYGDMLKLFEYHFDVFGLIKEGLAIDINTPK